MIKAYNKRTKKTEDIASIDFVCKTIHLKQHKSNPPFIYKEKLENVIILQEMKRSNLQREDKTTLYIASEVL